MTADRADVAIRHETRAWIALVILALIGLLGFFSGALVSILLEPIKLSFGVSDGQIGLLNGLAIAAVSAFAAFPIGLAADRFGRRQTLGYCLLLWSAATLLMGLAPGFGIFAVGVVGINLGDAALLPIIYAMIPGLFSSDQRNLANSTMIGILLVGGYAMYGVAGALLAAFEAAGATALEPWRQVCIVVAASGLIFAILLRIVPTTAGSAGEPLSTPGFSQSAFLQFLKAEARPLLVTFIGSSIGMLAMSQFVFWGPAILERRFGLPTADANMALGFSMAASGAVGLLLATAILWRVAGKWGTTAGIRLIRIGCLLALPVALAMPFVQTSNQFLGLMMVIGACIGIALALIPLVLQNCAPNRFRSRIIALYPVVTLGLTILLPATIGFLSDRAGGTGTALLSINAAMLLGCLSISLALLKWIEPRYSDLARRVAEEDRNAEEAPCSLTLSQEHPGSPAENRSQLPR